MDRRYWILLAALLALAAGTEWIVWLLREQGEEPAFAGPPRSEYVLADYTLDALGNDGRRSFRLSGPRLVRRGEDGSLHAVAPRYLLIGADGATWHGTSEAAWVDRNGSLMKLQGMVELQRDGEGGIGAIDIETRDLLTRPRDGTFETPEPATIRRPGSILQGTGMRGDLDAKVLELLSDVQSTIKPARVAR